MHAKREYEFPDYLSWVSKLNGKYHAVKETDTDPYTGLCGETFPDRIVFDDILADAPERTKRCHSCQTYADGGEGTIRLPPTHMDTDDKERIGSKRNTPRISGYEWSFQCDCGSVAEPPLAITDGIAVECGDCGRTYDVTIQVRADDD